jgi:hypothetical protein
VRRLLLAAIVYSPILALAQYGTAPNNYYPDAYNGSTFTGVVSEAKDDQMTLTFTKGNKIVTFTGQFDSACFVSSQNGGRMKATDFPVGTVMTTFFNETKKKVNGKKISENLILAISFDVWHGQRIPEEKKMVFSCTENRRLQFKGFQ